MKDILSITAQLKSGDFSEKMYIDAHCHHPSPGPDVLALWNVPPGELPDKAPPQTRLSSGIHPWETDHETAVAAAMARLTELVGSGRIHALGECGLDRLRGASPERQTEIFRQQLELAERHNLPVIIHCVRAFSELLALRKKYFRTPWLIHGFGGNATIAAQLQAAGCVLSFGPAAMRRPQTSNLIKSLPSSAWLLETDDSGEDIISHYRFTAGILNLAEPELERQLERNFAAFFSVVPHNPTGTDGKPIA